MTLVLPPQCSLKVELKAIWIEISDILALPHRIRRKLNFCKFSKGLVRVRDIT